MLLVEDDDAFRIGLETNLVDDGHPVVAHASVGALAAGAPIQADVAILDYELPGANGLAIADALHAAEPDTAIVLVTAYWTADLEEQLARRTFVGLCRKPVDYDDLHALVHALAGARPAP